MTLSASQSLIIISMVALGTVITRFLPFVLFRGGGNAYVNYLGKVLPYASVGLLVVYCLKDISFINYSYGIPEAIAIICIIVLHYWKNNTLISIGAGTVIYMLLVQTIFV